VYYNWLFKFLTFWKFINVFIALVNVLNNYGTKHGPMHIFVKFYLIFPRFAFPSLQNQTIDSGSVTTDSVFGTEWLAPARRPCSSRPVCECELGRTRRWCTSWRKSNACRLHVAVMRPRVDFSFTAAAASSIDRTPAARPPVTTTQFGDRDADSDRLWREKAR